MKSSNRASDAEPNGDEVRAVVHANAMHAENGHVNAENLSVILAGLQTMRDGDFSVRLPGDWTGLEPVRRPWPSHPPVSP